MSRHKGLLIWLIEQRSSLVALRNIQLSHSSTKGARVETEPLCRAVWPLDYPICLLEHLHNVSLFDFIERAVGASDNTVESVRDLEQ